MSTIITFYTAANDDAAEDDGPGRDAVEFRDFDVFASLEEWESLLLDRTGDAIAGPEQVNDEESPLILGFLPKLTAALARADAATLRDLTARWIAARAADGETLDPSLARKILGAVTTLARSRRRLYCQVA
ncbi:hypothetical protein GCM10010168_30190 [Actinoplanes ianthinogenes]|uniref:Uncharacterized protein n=1 Tax=Actinoplanes ianthinogenes TaxID=122358 RepID=A0ABN6C6E6_9ACTN|nr:hypothetical protein [Actinoplanes ianthinogenes]BCJ40161.1 hypothetical protein Aiant_08180 [Actinoplanes ianthinogenes]GGR10666.1 hypothetical protein GCM10010168_30190 [Actinoplanes ianthinogenes]